MYQTAQSFISPPFIYIALFESIEGFLSRLDINLNIPFLVAIKEIVVKVIGEVFSTLALATKKIEKGRQSKSCPS